MTQLVLKQNAKFTEDLTQQLLKLRAEMQDVRHALSIPPAPDAPPAATYDHPRDPHWGV